MTSSDHSRDPCPYNIVSDIGVGFAMGSIGGTVWHGFKGYRNSPRGERLLGAITSVKARAPITGGNFAVWSGLFNAVDCCFAGLRQKEDVWNPIMAGAATGAILAGRSGGKAMMVSALFGGTILAVMEGVGALINRMSSETYAPVAPPLPESPSPSPSMNKGSNSSSSSSSSRVASATADSPSSSSAATPGAFSLFKGRFGGSSSPH